MKTVPLFVILLLTVGISGCGLLVGTVIVGTAAVVGTVGAAGYTVYKGGEAVVSGVGSVGSSAKSLVVSDGTLKAECGYSVVELYDAAQSVLRSSDFTHIKGAKDSLYGEITARTAFSDGVSVKFKLLKESLTSVEIKIGEGNLKQAEYIYDKMLTIVQPASEGTQ